ncbi:oxidoreductase C-terminal domain-containing protein, partial [Francisella tularensis]|uniref:oxidoreductase C-terminal domain-containing protein n=1 Tax=Francisella tularensis TaxID=263 RepID=UPI00135E146E
VWTNQYDWKIQVVGQAGAAKRCLRVARQGNNRSFAEIAIDQNGTTCGGVAINWPRALTTCRRVLRDPVATRQPAQELADTLASTSR